MHRTTKPKNEPKLYGYCSSRLHIMGRIYLDKNHTIIYYTMNITKAIEVAKQKGFNEIYLIWWSQDIGWYSNVKVPENFKRVHSSGRIGIYSFLNI